MYLGLFLAMISTRAGCMLKNAVQVSRPHFTHTDPLITQNCLLWHERDDRSHNNEIHAFLPHHTKFLTTWSGFPSGLIVFTALLGCVFRAYLEVVLTHYYLQTRLAHPIGLESRMSVPKI